MKNIVAYISILFFVLALVAGYFFYKTNMLVVPIATPTPIVEIKSEIYINPFLGFEVTLPSDLIAEERTGGKVVLIGDKIIIYELLENPEVCKTDCPIINKAEDKIINNINGRYLEGSWEETETTSAQSFVSFVIPRDDKYLAFTLQELPFETPFEAGRKTSQINTEQIGIFNQIIATFRLLN